MRLQGWAKEQGNEEPISTGPAPHCRIAVRNVPDVALGDSTGSETSRLRLRPDPLPHHGVDRRGPQEEAMRVVWEASKIEVFIERTGIFVDCINNHCPNCQVLTLPMDAFERVQNETLANALPLVISINSKPPEEHRRDFGIPWKMDAKVVRDVIEPDGTRAERVVPGDPLIVIRIDHGEDGGNVSSLILRSPLLDIGIQR